jgi:hypothetical protein
MNFLKSAVLALATLPAFAAAQSLHITATHKATRDDEKTYRTAFNQNIITGVIGNRQYTFEQLASWGFYHFEVGTDYPVISADDKAVKVTVTDKKGKASSERLNVVSVEEVAK